MRASMINLCQHFGVKFIISTCSALILKLFGGDLLVYEVLAILVSIDMIMTIWVGIRERKLSHKMLFKKIGDMAIYTFLLISFHQLTRLSAPMNWFYITASLYCAITEMVNIAQNANLLGLKIPSNILLKLNKYLDNPIVHDKR